MNLRLEQHIYMRVDIFHYLVMVKGFFVEPIEKRYNFKLLVYNGLDFLKHPQVQYVDTCHQNFLWHIS